MFDVLPPAPPRRPSFASRRSVPPRRRVIAASTTPQAPGPRVVKLEWRLPARLRRPIRQELARERHKKKTEQSIVAFERRPIYSQVPDDHPAYGRPAVAPTNKGAEHHTGDVYYHSRPSLSLQLPPYRGRVVPPSEKITPPLRVHVPLPVKTPVPPPRTPAPQTRAAAVAFLGADVRDVPYRWTQALESKPGNAMVDVNEAQQLLAPIKQPKRRFTLPLHLSVFPWRKKNVANPSGNQAKKKR